MDMINVYRLTRYVLYIISNVYISFLKFFLCVFREYYTVLRNIKFASSVLSSGVFSTMSSVGKLHKSEVERGSQGGEGNPEIHVDQR